MNKPENNVSIEDIDTLENEKERIDQFFMKLGRSLYILRNKNEPLGTNYYYDGYSIERCTGKGYSYEGEIKWPLGMLMVSVSYDWSYQGGCDMEYVTFPAEWLGKDMEEILVLEKERLAEIRLAEKEIEKKKKEQEEFNRIANEAKKREEDRKEYKRLKELFEGVDPDDD